MADRYLNSENLWLLQKLCGEHRDKLTIDRRVLDKVFKGNLQHSFRKKTIRAFFAAFVDSDDLGQTDFNGFENIFFQDKPDPSVPLDTSSDPVAFESETSPSVGQETGYREPYTPFQPSNRPLESEAIELSDLVHIELLNKAQHLLDELSHHIELKPYSYDGKELLEGDPRKNEVLSMVRKLLLFHMYIVANRSRLSADRWDLWVSESILFFYDPMHCKVYRDFVDNDSFYRDIKLAIQEFQNRG